MRSVEGVSGHRTALVTGAGRGIGAATAHVLARRGFHVVVNYRSDAGSAGQVVRDIESAGGSARAIAADVTDAGAVADLVAQCDRLDALVCNANIQPPFASIANLSWRDFVDKVSGELAAAFHVTKAALPLMARGSHIVYVSSVAAETVRSGGIALSTAKAALDAFARHVAEEAGPDGIAVNIVSPGAVRTDASAAVLTPEVVAERARRSVLGRILEPTDVGALVGALASGELPGVAGVRIPIDGG
jgi:3-oxoacyl-[acyl-carrier protein] reductase